MTTLHPQGRRMVTVVFPDDCSARMTEQDALALMIARGERHGLRVYEVGWDGRHDVDGGYLAMEPERRREAPIRAEIARTRAIQSVERDLTAEQRARIAADAERLGPEATGRRWGLSKHSIQQVLRLQGRAIPARGRWKSRSFSRAFVAHGARA